MQRSLVQRPQLFDVPFWAVYEFEERLFIFFPQLRRVAFLAFLDRFIHFIEVRELVPHDVKQIL